MRWGICVIALFILIMILFPQKSLSLYNASPSQSDFIDDYLKNLDSGKIYFNPSEEMTVGVAEDVLLKLTRENLSGGEDIKLGDYMTAQLNGDAFVINPLYHNEQLVPREGFTTWEWRITPQEYGNQTLNLLVSVRLKIPDDGEEVKDLPVYQKHIHVRVNPAYSIKSYFWNNQYWIIPTIIGICSGIIGLIIRKLKK
jgi:hypothetical protein